MERIRFGRTGLMVSRVAFGGIPIMRLSKPKAVKLVRAVIDMGINFIDTAHRYNDGEEKIGEAIKGIPRDNLVIASKSPANDRKAFDEHLDLSLRRLGIDCLDIYHLHMLLPRNGSRLCLVPAGLRRGFSKPSRREKCALPLFRAIVFRWRWR
jgi:aryl-alcohol dehydrogenase-like predicted oxidoreductase